jgi:hypothetical protein
MDKSGYNAVLDGQFFSVIGGNFRLPFVAFRSEKGASAKSKHPNIGDESNQREERSEFKRIKLMEDP